MSVVSLSIGEVCAVQSEERVANEAGQRADLLDVAFGAMHALLESAHSSEIIDSIERS